MWEDTRGLQPFAEKTLAECGLHARPSAGERADLPSRSVDSTEEEGQSASEQPMTKIAFVLTRYEGNKSERYDRETGVGWLAQI